MVEHRKGVRVRANGRDGRDGRNQDAVLEIYASTGKTMLWTLVFFALTLTSVVVTRVLGSLSRGYPHSFYNTPTMEMLVQFGGGALFGGLTRRMLTILFSKAPRVVVSHEGISVNSLLFRFTLIPWTDIAALVVDGPRMLSVTTLHIVLRNRQTLRDRQNQFEMLLWRLGGYALVWPQSVPVSDALLPMSNVELVGRMRVNFQPELVQHGVQV